MGDIGMSDKSEIIVSNGTTEAVLSRRLKFSQGKNISFQHIGGSCEGYMCDFVNTVAFKLHLFLCADLMRSLCNASGWVMEQSGLDNGRIERID